MANDAQETCIRCWKHPLAQPVLLNRGDAIGHFCVYINRGCMHPVTLTVSYDEFCAIRDDEGLPVSNEISLTLKTFADPLTISCRPPPHPLPFPVLVQAAPEHGPYGNFGNGLSWGWCGVPK